MSTVLSIQAEEKILDYCASQLFAGMIRDDQYDTICDWIHNEDGFYDYLQDWLWEDIQFSNADQPGFGQEAGQKIISRMILKEIRNELAKCNPDLVKQALNEWLDHYKDE